MHPGHFNVLPWYKKNISFFNNFDLQTSMIRLYSVTYTEGHLIRERHIGHLLSIDATVSEQAVQKLECPHGTSATPARGAIRQTSQQSSDCCDVSSSSAAAAAVPAAVGGWSHSSSFSSVSRMSSMTPWKASVCAPRLWLTETAFFEYEPWQRIGSYYSSAECRLWCENHSECFVLFGHRMRATSVSVSCRVFRCVGKRDQIRMTDFNPSPLNCSDDFPSSTVWSVIFSAPV